MTEQGYSEREQSEQNYQAANIAPADMQTSYMLFAIWHELRRIAEALERRL